MKKKICVIGGANIDISAHTLLNYKEADSNPAEVSICYGGVARNVAHNLCLLGHDVSFISVFADDVYGRALKADCETLGMDLQMSLEPTASRSNYFLCINNEQGEMMAGAADMQLMQYLTPAFIEQHITAINQFNAVVADCNLDVAVLQLLAAECQVPLFIDATSSAKAEKLLSLLPWRNNIPLTIKVNRAEAEQLSSQHHKEQMADWFTLQGVENTYITLGKDGACCKCKERFAVIPSYPVNVVNATGAGDAFMAGVIHGQVNETDLATTLSYGVRMSQMTLIAEEPVNNQIKNIQL